jgi:hypothetical protein
VVCISHSFLAAFHGDQGFFTGFHLLTPGSGRCK